jgi:hypothetical protein
MAQQDLDAVVQTLERLTPIEKLVLIERLARSLQDISARLTPSQQRDALRRLRQELKGLPVCNLSDGFANREHDQLLYGNGCNLMISGRPGTFFSATMIRGGGLLTVSVGP